MPTFLARRLAFLVFVVIGVSLLTFAISHVVPSDPARLLLGKTATVEEIAAIRHELGLDQPLPVQYLIYMGHLLHGDFGQSTSSHRPVIDDFGDYFPATIELTFFALTICLLIGLPLGVLSALSKDRWLDQITRVLSIAGVALPLFWLGLVLQVLIYGRLRLLPAEQRLDLFVTPPQRLTGLYTLDSLLTGNWAALGNSLRHVILPALTLAFASLATVTRVTRASMLESLGQDYIRTARAKGLRRRLVVYRHALRNALIPTTTLMGLQVGNLLAGAFLVEIVFSWPGIGFYSVQAIRAFDYAAIMGVTIIIALVYSVVNLIVDLLYLILDPRISYV
jgi:peptide/nickel transport system permease protein